MLTTQQDTNIQSKLQVLVLSEALQKIVDVGHECSEWSKVDIQRVAANALQAAGLSTG